MPLRDVAAYAQRAERLGFDGLLVPEAVHDGFLTSLIALEHTSRLIVATSVALAFPRSPMTVAYSAWDLQALSGGRFVLGLGSQVKANIVGRFSVPWTPPVARMRDYVGALRAIWRSWQTGEKLEFESQSYRFDRMQPFFAPEPIEHGDVPIFLGGVNPAMMRLAGEAADGLMTHPTNTGPRYLRDRIRPDLDAGAARTGRAGTDVRILASTFVATGATADDVAAERERLRELLGFLYSTPHYRRTLELHGWADVGERLHAMSREGRWGEMKAEVSDEMLDVLVPSGVYADVASIVHDWYAGLVSAVTLRIPPDDRHDAEIGAAIDQLRSR